MLRLSRKASIFHTCCKNQVTSLSLWARYKSDTSFRKETFSFSHFKHKYVKPNAEISPLNPVDGNQIVSPTIITKENPSPSKSTRKSINNKSRVQTIEDESEPLGVETNRLLDGIKRQINKYSDHVVLTQLGSFYELYFHHATDYGPLLNLRVSSKKATNKNTHQVYVPMAGFPCYQLDSHLRILCQELKVSVAIFDQHEKSKNINPTLLTDKMKFDRRLTRIVTPGTLINDTFIDWQQDNYLLALTFENNTQFDKDDTVGLAWINLGVGKFHYSSTKLANLVSDISRINPKEILMDTNLKNNTVFDKVKGKHNLFELQKYFVSYQSFPNQAEFETGMLEDRYYTQEKTDMSFSESKSVYGILKYIHSQYPELKFKLSFPQPKKFDNYMKIDYGSRDSLELFRPLRNYESKADTLFSILKNTVTDQGTRLLKEWIDEPLLDIDKINARQTCVAELKSNAAIQRILKTMLLSSNDPERTLQKIEVGLDHLYDLYKLGVDLEMIGNIKAEILNLSIKDSALKHLVEPLNSWESLSQYLVKNLNIKLILKTMEEEEMGELENGTTETHRRHGTNEWLINPGCTPELKKLHSKLSATTGFELARVKQEIQDEENKIIKNMRNHVLQHKFDIRKNCHIISQIDVLLSFTTLANDFGLTRPIVTTNNNNSENNNVIDIKGSRHLGVQYNLLKENAIFTENDCNIDSAKTHIITGPNMGGKSTYLRQIAITIILAQIGCFVPAESATISLVDQIFCRIGSNDDLSKGQSTFAIEMKETANILNNATSQSFVIIDEIGRGTGYKDGLAIAYSCLVYLSEKIGCRMLFATHFGYPLKQLVLKREERQSAAERESETEKGDGKEESQVSKPENYRFYCTNLVKLDEEMYYFDRKLAPGLCNNSQGLLIASQTRFPKKALEYTKNALHEIKMNHQPV